ncbi:MAG: universal stress protein [Nitrosopumilus sp.]
MKKILVPFDGSEGSEKAFEEALEIASKFGSKLIALTVLHAKLDNSLGMSPERLGELQDEQTDEANAMLKILEEKADAKNVQLSTKVVHNPSSAEGIASYADSNNVDLIVMGSHGRTGLRKIVLGSVANAVIGHVKCSVLITKATR